MSILPASARAGQGRPVVVAGGTTESRIATESLLSHGFRVLWSQATDAPFQLEPHHLLTRRQGRLDALGWTELLTRLDAAAVVDAAHPHATFLHQTLLEVTSCLQLTLVRLKRDDVAVDAEVATVSCHADAAELACTAGRSVLLTLGTRQLAPYVAQARTHGAKLTARVLDAEESRRAVSELGLLPYEVVFGRGPYSLDQNLELIRRTRADVLVLKDSGKEGGMIEKLQAAKLAGCSVVLVRRPAEPADAATSIEALIHRLSENQP